MHQLLQDSRDDARSLERQMRSSHRNINLLKQFFKEIKASHESFATTLKEISERFYHSIMKEDDEEEALLYCYNYICHYTLNISHLYNTHAANIQNRILEPFDLFAENFNETNRTLIQNAAKLLDLLQESKVGVYQKQENYYKAARDYEKHAERNQEVLKKAEKGYMASREHINMVSYQTANRKEYLDQCTEEYKKSVLGLNQKLENYETEFSSIFENFGLNEESKLNFTKLNISQMIKSLNDMHTSIKDSFTTYSAQGFEKKVVEIESKISFKVPKSKKLLKSVSSTVKPMKKESFVSYEAWKKSQKGFREGSEKENPSISDTTASLPEKSPVDNLIAYLLEERSKTALGTESLNTTRDSISEESTWSLGIEKAATILADSKTRKFFLSTIVQASNKAKQIPVKRSKWGDFRKVATSLIQGFVSNKDRDGESFYNLIEFLTKFYLDDQSKRIVYLISQFKGSVIWEDIERWENLVYYLYHRKKLTDHSKNSEPGRELSEIANSSKKEAVPITPRRSNIISEFFRIGKSASGFEAMSKRTLDEKALKVSVFDQIYLMLVQIDLRPETASSVLTQVGRKIEIDEGNLEVLKNSLDKKSDENLRLDINSKQRRHTKKLHKYGQLLAISLSLEFLPNDKNLINVLLTCKSWNTTFKRKIQKLAFLSAPSVIPKAKRIALWKQRLELSNVNFAYADLKEKLKAVEATPHIEDLIRLDVQRSFCDCKDVSQELLEELLKLFARYNPELSYCQGMNYIIGFLYYQFRDEEDTFRFYVAIVEKYLSQVFESDLSNIPFLFYLLDRVLSIFLPDLANHFNNQKIESNLYSASWFITIFSNAFQYNEESALLIAIWDLFVLEGWKGFYKATMAIFEFSQPKLLEMKFDHLMNFLNGCVQNSIFSITTEQLLRYSNGEIQADSLSKEQSDELVFVRDFKQITRRFNVSSDLLQSLEATYNPKSISKH